MALETPPEPTLADEHRGIDAGVIQDARARQRRHRRGFGGVVLTAALASGILAVGLGGGGGRASSARHDHARRPNRSVASNPSQRPVVLLRRVGATQAYAAGGRLYVIESPNSKPSSRYVNRLIAVSTRTRRVLAARQLGSAYLAALLAKHALWLTTYRGSREWLWRLDPGTLAVLSKEPLPERLTGDALDGSFGSLAAAGGWLWVGDWGELDRVSLETARVNRVITVKGSHGVDLSSDAGGSVLLDSEGLVHWRLQRRDPRTGRLLEQTPPSTGLMAPRIGGVFAGGFWISDITGMLAVVERLSVASLRPIRAEIPARAPFSNAVNVTVVNGTLWITGPPGARQPSYCGSAATGHPDAKLHLGANAIVLTESAQSYYYLVSTPSGEDLDQARIRTRC